MPELIAAHNAFMQEMSGETAEEAEEQAARRRETV